MPQSPQIYVERVATQTLTSPLGTEVRGQIPHTLISIEETFLQDMFRLHGLPRTYIHASLFHAEILKRKWLFSSLHQMSVYKFRNRNILARSPTLLKS